ncbi:DDE-type integrase/transposase/recombinase [Aestuariivirga sp.]|uniref:DDE-type integrase/transposase/recombinase n=1 Tax=Aestuariivirga sp. TaxID=2650926 RepID=UPI0035939281
MNRAIFEADVEAQFAPAFKPGDIVIFDKLSSHKSEGAEAALGARGAWLTHCLWRAVDHEGEFLEAYVSKKRDRTAALKFLRKTINRHGTPHAFVTDKLRAYWAALKDMGIHDVGETGRWLNNRAENSHQSFRRRARAMLRFRKMGSLQMFVAAHSSIHDHSNLERSLSSRNNFKASRTVALAEWRQVCTA